MTGPCSRRTLLRTGTLAAAGLAGCVGGRGGETADTATTAETQTETDFEPPLAVADVRVQSSFVRRTTPDSATVAAPEGTHFVFATVRPTASDASPPAADEIALVADDRRFDGTTTPGSATDPYQLSARGSFYDPDERESGWVAFAVPDPLDADSVSFAYDVRGRTVSESPAPEVLDALAEPPAEFELVAVDAPDSIARGESFEVSLTVENASDADGAFRAVLNQTHPAYTFRTVEVAVPAGASREWTGSFPSYEGSGADSANYRLVSPAGERELTVEVAPGTADRA